MIRKSARAALVLFILTCFSSAALAHVGDHSHMSFAEGLAHPFTGLDHMLAMVAVGLWASQLGRPAHWLLPAVFPLVMAIGAVFGMSGRELPLLEIGIAGSVIVLGAAIALALRPSLVLSAALVAGFALLHGYSHGAELPADVSGLTFAIGFIAATLVLHAIGIGLGLLADRIPVHYLARSAGAAIAAAGLVLLAAA